MQFEPKEPISGLNPHVSIMDTEESTFGVHQKHSFHCDFLHKEYNCIHLIQNHTLNQFPAIWDNQGIHWFTAAVVFCTRLWM